MSIQTFFKRLLVGITATLFSAAPSAQTCEYNSILSNTPTNRFDVDGATVLDTSTSLRWHRCYLGTTWNDVTSSCEENGEDYVYDWQEALEVAVLNSLDSYTDWRLPNIKELASIVEQACHSPAINLEIFPSTPSSRFWSSSPESEDAYTYSVDFNHGHRRGDGRRSSLYVRLVRSE